MISVDDNKYEVQPKRPRSAYNIFIQETLQKLKENKNYDQNKAFAKSAAILVWKEMSDDEKKQYKEKAAQDQQRYTDQLSELKEKGFFTTTDGKKSTDPDIDIKRAACKVNLKTRLKAIKKSAILAKEMQKPTFVYEPKKGRTSQMLFNQETIAKIKMEQEGLKLSEIYKQSADIWKNLSDADKKEWNDKAQKDQQRYLDQIKEFREKGYFTLADGKISTDPDVDIKKHGVRYTIRAAFKTSRRLKKCPPKKFTKGRWNPDIMLASNELYKSSPGTKFIGIDDNPVIANLNMIRAVINNDPKLLKNCIYSTTMISDLNQNYSPTQEHDSAIYYLFKYKRYNLLKLLFQNPKKDVLELHETREQEEQDFKRIMDSRSYKQTVEFLSDHDTAFKSQQFQKRKIGDELNNNNLLQIILGDRELTLDNIKEIHQILPNLSKKIIDQHLKYTLKSGNIDLCLQLMEQQDKKNGGFNSSFSKLTKFMEDYKDGQNWVDKSETTKGTEEEFSAINTPENQKIILLKDWRLFEKIIEKVLAKDKSLPWDPPTDSTAVKQPFQITDYSHLLEAACVSNSLDQLELLKKYQFDFFDCMLEKTDGRCKKIYPRSGTIPLYDAVKYDLVHVLKFYSELKLPLEVPVDFLAKYKFKEQENHTLLTQASIQNSEKCLKFLIQMSSSQITRTGYQLLSPIHHAVKHDNFKSVEILCDNKGRVNLQDRDLKSALHYACVNGQTKIVSLLLQRGADWELEDSQKNRPLHYAAAFGWIDIVQMLVEQAKANINCKNNWNNLPVQLAILKNQSTVAQYLLGQENISFDALDRNGRTLLTNILFMAPVEIQAHGLPKKQQLTAMFEKIIKRGCDWSIADNNKSTPIHYVALFFENNKSLFDSKSPQRQLFIDFIGEVFMLLVDHGADIYHRNERTQLNALDVVLNSGQKWLMKLFVPYIETGHQLGEIIHKMIDTNPSLIHDEEYLQIIGNLIELQMPNLVRELQTIFVPGSRVVTRGLQDRNFEGLNAQVLSIRKDGRFELKFENGKTRFVRAEKLTEAGTLTKPKKESPAKSSKENQLKKKQQKSKGEVDCANLEKQTSSIKYLILKQRLNSKTLYLGLNHKDKDGLTPIHKYFKTYLEQSKIIDKKNDSSFDLKTEAFLDLLRIMTKNGAISKMPVRTQDKQMAKDSRFQSNAKQAPFTASTRAVQLFNPLYSLNFDSETTDSEDEFYGKGSKYQKAKKQAEKQDKKIIQTHKVQTAQQEQMQIMSSEYGPDGLKNLWHFLIDTKDKDLINDPNLLEFLTSEQVSLLAEDKYGRMPLNMLMHSKLFTVEMLRYFEEHHGDVLFEQISSNKLPIFELLESSGQPLELLNFFKSTEQYRDFILTNQDRNGATLFLKYTQINRYEEAEFLIEAGADINHQCTRKMNFAIKYIIEQQDMSQLIRFEKVCKEKSKQKINWNLKDKKERTLMHMMINKTKSSITDANFEFAQFLIDRKVDLSLKDIKGRTCLHYVFKKFGDKGNNGSQNKDPIEIVSNLLGLEGIDINQKDIWMKTPLHYACEVGASTCALYLMSCGADFLVKDVFGNNSLGIAVINKRWDIAINIMQKNIDCNDLVVPHEDYKRQSRIWDGDLSSDDEPPQKCSIFKLAIMSNQDGLAYLTLSTYDLTKAFIDAIESKLFQFCFKIDRKINKSKMLGNMTNDRGENLIHILLRNYQTDRIQDDQEKLKDLDKHLKLLMDRGVKLWTMNKDKQSILHILFNKRMPSDSLLLDYFFDSTHKCRTIDPIADLESSKMTIKELINAPDIHGKSIVEKVFMHSHRSSLNNQLLKKLIELGADLFHQQYPVCKISTIEDIFKRDKEDNEELEKEANQAKQIELKLSKKLIPFAWDKKKDKTLGKSSAFKGADSLKIAESFMSQESQGIQSQLIQSQTEDHQPNIFGLDQMKDAFWYKKDNENLKLSQNELMAQTYNNKSTYAAPLAFIYAYDENLWTSSTLEQCKANLKWLCSIDIQDQTVRYKTNISETGIFDKECVDSLGCDIMMVAIKRRIRAIQELILEELNSKGRNTQQIEECQARQDYQGNSAAHFAIHTFVRGYQANEWLVRRLAESGFKLDLVNNTGNSPLNYTEKLLSKKMNSLLRKLLKLDEEIKLTKDEKKALKDEQKEEQKGEGNIREEEKQEDQLMSAEMVGPQQQDQQQEVKKDSQGDILVTEDAQMNAGQSILDKDKDVDNIKKDIEMEVVAKMDDEDSIEMVVETEEQKIDKFLNKFEQDLKNCQVPFYEQATTYLLQEQNKIRKQTSKAYQKHEAYEPWFKGDHYQVLKEMGLEFSVCLVNCKAEYEYFRITEHYNFCKLQILHDLNAKNWVLLTHQGRVGKQQDSNVSKMEAFQELEKAREAFLEKFTKMTGENFILQRQTDELMEFDKISSINGQRLSNSNEKKQKQIERIKPKDLEKDQAKTEIDQKSEFPSQISVSNNKNQVEGIKKPKERYFVVNEPKEQDYNFKELLTNFEYQKAPKSRQSKKVKNLVKGFIHPGLFRDFAKNHQQGLDINSSLAISSISKEKLDQATEILAQLEFLIKQNNQLRKEGLAGGNDKMKAQLMEKLYLKTLKYFEIIPNQRFQVSQMRPFENQNQIDNQYKLLHSMRQFGLMSYVYLGALSQQKKVNPVDYFIDVFKTKFKQMHKKDLETLMIQKFVNNTWTSKSSQEYISDIFKVERADEEQRLAAFSDLSKNMLLFHGSTIHQHVGIFLRGLNINPDQNSVINGSALGKGIYFTDCFEKALQYARSQNYDVGMNKSQKLVLICEVATGKPKITNSYKDITQLAPGYSSVKLRGVREPDLKDNLQIEENGRIMNIPQGKSIDVIKTYMPGLSPFVSAPYSEYVVYKPEQVRIRYIVQLKKMPNVTLSDLRSESSGSESERKPQPWDESTDSDNAKDVGYQIKPQMSVAQIGTKLRKQMSSAKNKKNKYKKGHQFNLDDSLEGQIENYSNDDLEQEIQKMEERDRKIEEQNKLLAMAEEKEEDSQIKQQNGDEFMANEMNGELSYILAAPLQTEVNLNYQLSSKGNQKIKQKPNKMLKDEGILQEGKGKEDKGKIQKQSSEKKEKKIAEKAHLKIGAENKKSNEKDVKQKPSKKAIKDHKLTPPKAEKPKMKPKQEEKIVKNEPKIKPKQEDKIFKNENKMKPKQEDKIVKNEPKMKLKLEEKIIKNKGDPKPMVQNQNGQPELKNMSMIEKRRMRFMNDDKDKNMTHMQENMKFGAADKSDKKREEKLKRKQLKKTPNQVSDFDKQDKIQLTQEKSSEPNKKQQPMKRMRAADFIQSDSSDSDNYLL